MKRLIAILTFTVSCAAVAAEAFPPGIDDTADRIREGKLDIGKDYTLAVKGRYHVLHEKLGLDCTFCHTSPKAPDFLYLRKAEFPKREHPGATGNAACIGCHQKGGIATHFYGAVGN